MPHRPPLLKADPLEAEGVGLRDSPIVAFGASESLGRAGFGLVAKGVEEAGATTLVIVAPVCIRPGAHGDVAVSLSAHRGPALAPPRLPTYLEGSRLAQSHLGLGTFACADSPRDVFGYNGDSVLIQAQL